MNLRQLTSIFFYIIFLHTINQSFATTKTPQESGFEIHVTFTNHEGVVLDGEKISLRKGGGNEILASAVFEKGVAILRGRVDRPTVTMLHTQNAKLIKGKKILVENTKYEITFSSTNPVEILDGAKFKTSSSFHNVWYDFFEHQNELSQQSAVLVKQHKNFIVKAQQPQADSIMAQIEELKRQQHFMYKELGYTEPNNLATAYIYTAIPEIDEEYLEIYNGFSEQVKSSEWGQKAKAGLDDWYKNNVEGKAIDQNIHIHPLIGQVMPTLVGISPDGQKHSIDQKHMIESANKLTIIDFWASWCGPCRTMNISLYPMYYQLKDKGLEIYSFSLDQDKSKWLKAIDEDQIPWPNFSDLLGPTSPVRTNYKIMFLPTNALVDDSGKIIAVNVFQESDIIRYLEAESSLKK